MIFDVDGGPSELLKTEHLVSTRREFIQTGVFGIAAAVIEPSPVNREGRAAERARKPGLKGPILNHDSTAFFAAYSADHKDQLSVTP